jgi:hypothetical protein
LYSLFSETNDKNEDTQHTHNRALLRLFQRSINSTNYGVSLVLVLIRYVQIFTLYQFAKFCEVILLSAYNYVKTRLIADTTFQMHFLYFLTVNVLHNKIFDAN